MKKKSEKNNNTKVIVILKKYWWVIIIIALYIFSLDGDKQDKVCKLEGYVDYTDKNSRKCLYKCWEEDRTFKDFVYIELGRNCASQPFLN